MILYSQRNKPIEYRHCYKIAPQKRKSRRQGPKGPIEHVMQNTYEHERKWKQLKVMKEKTNSSSLGISLLFWSNAGF